MTTTAAATRLAVRTKVERAIESYLEVATEQCISTARLVEDLGADSLDQIELVLALEEEFSIDISDEDAVKFKTVGDIVAYVEQHV